MPTTYTSTSSPEWARVINTTLINFLRKEEVNMMRNRRLTALLQEKNRITYNWTGRETEVRVRYRRPDMTGYGDMDVVTFVRQDRWKTANLGLRGYNIPDMVTKKERLMNKGEEAVIKLFGQVGENLKKDMEDQFAEEYYVDGEATGNEKKMHGIESFMGQGGSTTVVNGFKSPTDTFAGLLTDLSNYGGTWTGTWPDGSGPPQYDFWSPLLIDYTDADAWQDGATWATNCVEILRTAFIYCQRNGAKDGLIDMGLMSHSMYRDLLTKLATVERHVFTAGNKSPLQAIGFRDVVQVDGTDATWEFGIPGSKCYGFNCDKMETRSWQPQLFVAEGPDWDPTQKAWKFSVDFFGNTFWNPRYFFKAQNYT